MPRRVLMFCLFLVAFGGAGGLILHYHNDAARRFDRPVEPAMAAAAELLPSWVAAPGFIEPVSKELRLGFDISGVIAEVLVAEGDRVTKGQTLAVLRRDEYRAQVREAAARLLEAKADYAMHRAGARQDERDRVKAELESAKTWLAQAQRELARREVLVKNRSIGYEELERARRDARVAAQDMAIARNNYALVEDRYREEEIEIARQRHAAAEAALLQAEAVFEKTALRAPVDGTVLRIFSDPGIAYSIFAPEPVLSMGDIDTLNIRAEVDEKDVGRIREGQKAFASAAAFGGRRFPGTVSRMELSMTPKKIRSGDPSEPVDRSVLEVLVRLDAPGPFRSGMRVDVYIKAEPAPSPFVGAH